MIWNYLRFEKRPWENPWLDFLRAIAVILVFFRHGERAYLAAHHHDSGAADYFMLNGWVGVDLFFVLSGFLIASNLLKAQKANKKNSITSYLVRRALRILPAYYAVLVLVVAGAFPGFAVSGENLTYRVIYHLFVMQDYLPSNINVVFWSLGVEEKFYLLAPGLVAFLAARKSTAALLWALLFLLLLSPVLRAITFFQLPENVSYEQFWPLLRSPFHASLEPLMMGVAIAAFKDRGQLNLTQSQARLFLFSSFAAGIIFFSSHEFMDAITWFDAVAQPVLIALIFGAAVAACCALEKAPPPPGEVIFRVTARLSYALYLIHFPLLPLAMNLSGSSAASPVVFWSVYFVLSMAVAALIHYLVEKPFLRWRRTILKTTLTAS